MPVCALPLVDALGSYGVDTVNVRDVKQGLISGRIRGEFHQNLIQEDGLQGSETGQGSKGIGGLREVRQALAAI